MRGGVRPLINLCETSQCTGCMACSDSCPVGAISFSEDDLGKLCPQINYDKCLECGKCRNSCPVINPVYKNVPQKVYAAYSASSDDRNTCTSGGMATVFSRFLIKNSGSVFGSAYTSNGSVEVMQADNLADIEKFKGSKYVYSSPGQAYESVKKALDAQKKCLYIGTPCQIAGLKNFLHGNDKNLVTVDLICHGVPPMKYLREYLEHLKIDDVGNIAFRGETVFKLCVVDKSGRVRLNKRQEEDIYYHSFLQCLTYREACYNCPYAGKERCSDITIGDFWGLDDKALDGYRGKKSVVLINTDKGQRLFDSVKKDLIFEERSLNEAVNGNAQLKAPSRKPACRKQFEDEYRKNGFVKAVKTTPLYKDILRNYVMNRIKAVPRFIKYKIIKH